MNQQFANNPAYVEYEGLLRSLHDLVANGNNDTPEAEVIHDRMDILEPQLSRHEIDRLNGLSSDLYMLQGQEILKATEMTSNQLGQAFGIAHNNNDWETVLRLLRQAPHLVSPDKVAYIRARAYEELGHLETSLLFMEHAAKINPNNENYEYFVVERLQRLKRSPEALEYAARQMESGHRSASFRIQYASLLFMSTHGLSAMQATPLYERAIDILNEALPEASQDQDLPPNVVVMGFLVLGSCYEGLGQIENAILAYTRTLEIDPNNADAYTLRGVIQARNDLNSAINDLERAVNQNTPDLAPYIWLAYISLLRQDFQRCINLCKIVRGKTSDAEAIAAAYQWTSIAQYLSEAPINSVVHNARRSSDFDPISPQIQQTLRLFEAMLQPSDLPLLPLSEFQPVDVRSMNASQPDVYSLNKPTSLALA